MSAVQCPECQGTTFTDRPIQAGGRTVKILKKCSSCGISHNPGDLVGARYKVMRKIRLDHKQKAAAPH